MKQRLKAASKKKVVSEVNLQEPEVEIEDDIVLEPDFLPDKGDLDDFSTDQEVSSENVPTRRVPIRRASGALIQYNPLDAYLAEIRRFSPLTREEEMELALQYKKDQSSDAAYKLVSSNLWLVVKIARDYERVARNILDLIQEGNIGLMEAVRNFDPYRGVRFPSYAVWWIKAYMIRFIVANWRLVKIGTTQAQRKLFFNLKKESERFEKLGIFPTPKLLAERMNVKEGDVIEMSQRMGSADTSVDAPLPGGDPDATLHSMLPSAEESVEDRLAQQQIGVVLTEALKQFEQILNPKELVIYHGRVMNEEKLTLQEISDQLLVSKERVRQIENKIREKLKVFVRERLGSELHEWIGSEV